MRSNGGEIMAISMDKSTLHGWDDERVYYWDGTQEWCVSDHPDLVVRLLEICRDYFADKDNDLERVSPGGYRKPRH
jgi:hypothetical protein